MYFGWRSRTKPFKVTPKAASEESVLSARWLLPMFLLGAIPGWVVCIMPSADLVLGPALMCILECTTYLVALLAIIGLHLGRNYQLAARARHSNVMRRRHTVTFGVTILFLASVVTLTEVIVRIAHGLA
jgi:hypothetical protein